MGADADASRLRKMETLLNALLLAAGKGEADIPAVLLGQMKALNLAGAAAAAQRAVPALKTGRLSASKGGGGGGGGGGNGSPATPAGAPAKSHSHPRGGSNSRPQTPRRVENMYQAGLVKMGERQREHMTTKEVADLQHCTFAPNIDRRSKRGVGDDRSPFWERMGGRTASDRRQEKMRDLTLKNEELTLQGCTYHPVITRRGRRGRGDSPVAVFDRLNAQTPRREEPATDEEESAATKIQALARGRITRSRVESAIERLHSEAAAREVKREQRFRELYSYPFQPELHDKSALMPRHSDPGVGTSSFATPVGRSRSPVALGGSVGRPPSPSLTSTPPRGVSTPTRASSRAPSVSSGSFSPPLPPPAPKVVAAAAKKPPRTPRRSGGGESPPLAEALSQAEAAEEEERRRRQLAEEAAARQAEARALEEEVAREEAALQRLREACARVQEAEAVERADTLETEECAWENLVGLEQRAGAKAKEAAAAAAAAAAAVAAEGDDARIVITGEPATAATVAADAGLIEEARRQDEKDAASAAAKAAADAAEQRRKEEEAAAAAAAAAAAQQQKEEADRVKAAEEQRVAAEAEAERTRQAEAAAAEKARHEAEVAQKAASDAAAASEAAAAAEEQQRQADAAAAAAAAAAAEAEAARVKQAAAEQERAAQEAAEKRRQDEAAAERAQQEAAAAQEQRRKEEEEAAAAAAAAAAAEAEEARRLEAEAERKRVTEAAAELMAAEQQRHRAEEERQRRQRLQEEETRERERRASLRTRASNHGDQTGSPAARREVLVETDPDSDPDEILKLMRQSVQVEISVTESVVDATVSEEAAARKGIASEQTALKRELKKKQISERTFYIREGLDTGSQSSSPSDAVSPTPPAATPAVTMYAKVKAETVEGRVTHTTVLQHITTYEAEYRAHFAEPQQWATFQGLFDEGAKEVAEHDFCNLWQAAASMPVGPAASGTASNGSSSPASTQDGRPPIPERSPHLTPMPVSSPPATPERESRTYLSKRRSSRSPSPNQHIAQEVIIERVRHIYLKTANKTERAVELILTEYQGREHDLYDMLCRRHKLQFRGDAGTEIITG